MTLREATPPGFMQPIGLAAIERFAQDDLAAAFAVFRRSAQRIATGEPAQRPALAAVPALIEAACAALAPGVDPASFFARWFAPHLLAPPGFVTAYYEVEVEARRKPQPGFRTPVLARPADLVTLNDSPLTGAGGETLAAARRREGGALEPFPDRRSVEEMLSRGDALAPVIAYVRDAVELFLMQVQGSARLMFEDGGILRLTYDGRNGHPYTSIGRLLIERGLVPAGEMSLDRLKQTVRAMGLGPGEAGGALLQENRSYVFFRADHSAARRLGPIGGEGVALTPLRSIAVDRTLWSYGLPFWISATIPWRGEGERTFGRLMIAQDTGSAILGPARADLFFGAGAEAGRRAGGVRHEAQTIVFLPRGAEPAP
jgi:membrane-bound lytic murein transglycosylase A